MSIDTLMRLSKALRISADYLLFGAPSESSGNPITEIYEGLTSEQREDVTNILRLYAKVCSSQQTPPQ